LNPSPNNRVQRLNLERLRVSSPSMIQVLTQDVIRQHIDRIEPACVADLFALAEATLPASLASDLRDWARRAEREILDLPAGEPRALFIAEVAELRPEDVPANLREVIFALGAASSAELGARVEELRGRWAEVPPAPVKVPVAAPTANKTAAPANGSAGATRTTASKPAAAPRARAVKTPASMVDPRRAEWIRGDAVARLGSREYAERGLKESIFVAGILHRTPYSDMTEEEVKTELRRLERERKIKHTGERWLIR
jgi:hypothetical protein